MAQLGFDNFTRANQTGFGLATDGINTWSTADFGSATLAINTNQGEFSTLTSVTGTHLGSATSANGHAFATATSSGMSSAFFFIMLRQTGATYYRAKLSGTALAIERVNAGTATTLGTAAFTANSATKYNLRFEITGGDTPTLRANAWQFGTAEPSTWLVSVASDSSPITGAGFFGIGAKINSTSATVDFTQFWVVPYLLEDDLTATESTLLLESAAMEDDLSSSESQSSSVLFLPTESLTVTEGCAFLQTTTLQEGLAISDSVLAQQEELASELLILVDANDSQASSSWSWGPSSVESLVITESTQIGQTYLAEDDSQIVETFSSTEGTINPDLPYGITFEFAGNYPYTPIFQQTINDIANLSAQPGMWLRLQAKWKVIEYTQTSPPTYDWTPIDDAVAKCAAQGINICFPLQGAPAWRQNIDINGNYVAATLATALTAGHSYTSIAVNALPANALFPNGVTTIDTGNGNQESFTVVGGPYTSGATSISISPAFVPAVNHAVNANILASNGNTGSAADYTAYAQQVAARYNGTSINALTGLPQPVQYIRSIQIGNEEFDSAGNTTQRDKQSQLLVPVVQQAAPAIRALHPTCVIGICAVRHLSGSTAPSLAHIQNWLTNLYTFTPVGGSQAGIGGVIDYLDFHYYRDGVMLNGLQSADPAIDIPTGTGAYVPSATRQLQLMQSISQSYATAGGFNAPDIRCQEFGWDIGDDGNGTQTTLTASLTAGTSYTSLQIATLGADIPDASLVTVSYAETTFGGLHQEQVYTYGDTPATATLMQVTTNYLGSGAPQAAWTPTYNHLVGDVVYNPDVSYLTGGLNQQNTFLTGSGEMLDMLRLGGASHAFLWTLNSNALDSSWILPNKINNTKTITAKVTSTYGGKAVYTYFPAYSGLQAYIAAHPNWATPLTVYLSRAQSATLTTANQLYQMAGSPTTGSQNALVGTATGFGELQARSQGTWAAFASIAACAPTGHGWFLDHSVSPLDGQQIVAGLWSAVVNLAAFQSGTQVGSLFIDIYVRAWRYRPSTTTYTNIVTMELAGITITASQDYTLPSTAADAMPFLAGDLLYIDAWANVRTNTNNSSLQAIRLLKQSSDTTGLTGSTESQIVSPGFVVQNILNLVVQFEDDLLVVESQLVLDQLLPVETLSLLESLLAQKSFAAQDALTASESWLVVESTLPTEGLSLIESLNVGEATSSTENLAVQESLLNAETFLPLEVGTLTDGGMSVGGTYLPSETQAVIEALLGNDGYTAQESAPIAETFYGSPQNPVYAFIEQLTVSESLVAMDALSLTETSLVPQSVPVMGMEGVSTDGLVASENALTATEGTVVETFTITDSILTLDRLSPLKLLTVVESTVWQIELPASDTVGNVSESSFYVSGLIPVSSLPVGEQTLVSEAYLTTEAGGLAEGVTFSPVAASLDLLSLTESQMIQVEASMTESASIGESLGVQETSSTIESGTLTESMSVGTSLTLAEPLTLLDGLLAQDALALLEENAITESAIQSFGTVSPSGSSTPVAEIVFIQAEVLKSETSTVQETTTVQGSLLVTEGLSTSESVQYQETSSATEGLSIQEQLGAQEGFMASEGNIVSGASAIVQVGTFTESLPLAETLLTEGAASVTEGLNVLETYLVQRGMVLVDLLTAMETLQVGEMYVPTEGLTLTETAALDFGPPPQTITISFTDLLAIAETAQWTELVNELENLGIDDSASTIVSVFVSYGTTITMTVPNTQTVIMVVPNALPVTMTVPNSQSVTMIAE